MIFQVLTSGNRNAENFHTPIWKLSKRHEAGSDAESGVFRCCRLLSSALWVRAQSTPVAVVETLAVPAIPVPMPEPSSPALLAVDLLSAAGLILLFRRRATGTNRSRRFF